MNKFQKISKRVRELQKLVAQKMDRDNLWMLVSGDVFKKASEINKKFNGGRVFDKRTRGGKYYQEQEHKYYQENI